MAEFGEQMRTWWRSIQPDWRRDSVDSTWPLKRHAPVSENWDALAKGGANSMMMFVLAITWWFRAVADEKAARELASVIEDVRWVVNEIEDGLKDGHMVEMLTKRGGAP